MYELPRSSRIDSYLPENAHVPCQDRLVVLARERIAFSCKRIMVVVFVFVLVAEVGVEPT